MSRTRFSRLACNLEYDRRDALTCIVDGSELSTVTLWT